MHSKRHARFNSPASPVLIQRAVRGSEILLDIFFVSEFQRVKQKTVTPLTNCFQRNSIVGEFMMKNAKAWRDTPRSVDRYRYASTQSTISQHAATGSKSRCSCAKRRAARSKLSSVAIRRASVE